MSRSQVVLELANLASRGRYSVTPLEATRMNKLFIEVAEVINQLEAEERETPDVEETPESK